MTRPASPSDAGAQDAALDLLHQFTTLHPRAWDLGLERMVRLLGAMGNPQDKLPPVFHVAGTNGKGSTVAFLRAALEAQGKQVHAYTSPHLVRFNERIRVAGSLVSDDALVDALRHCETVNGGKSITFFEATTATALHLFAETAADATLLEVGLGGRLDATNVIERPALCAITPVSMDHMGFLGDTLEKIATEKAGILKRDVPCVVAPQDEPALQVIRAVARRVGAPLIEHGQDFMAYEEHGRLVYQDAFGLMDLPLPRLAGRHQIINAGTAIACLRHTDLSGTDAEYANAMQTVQWPGRLQKLTGTLAARAPSCDVWLDGGHNAGGGKALAEAMADLEDRVPRPLYLISGLMRTKDATDFFRPFEGLARQVIGVPIPGHDKGLDTVAVAASASEAGTYGSVADSLEAALTEIEASAGEPARVLICGSLYLAGHALKADGYTPT
ncbi:MAG: bifunctional folylpolyglutamate synthase/dihydrofolate synthase [Devosiaceae bacterium]|nr:bifunctional folylpolyglutamate synthase/dihydrofolate synthase [Devosiaceae bacterium MH13]